MAPTKSVTKFYTLRRWRDGRPARPLQIHHRAHVPPSLRLRRSACYDFLMQRRYDYRRKLPHLQPDYTIFFITFSTSRRWTLPPVARDIVQGTCLRGDGRRYELHGLVVMPDHVHVALAPNRDERGTFSIHEIMQEIKSVSSHRMKQRNGARWTGLAGGVF